MIDTDKYEGHTPAPWKAMFNHPQVEGSCVVNDEDESNFGWTDGERILGPLWVGELTDDMPDTKLIADAPLLLAEVKRLRKALEIEEQIVQAFYEYREDCCFDHCEAWMLENGHRVMVKIDDDEQSEWKVEVE